MIKILFLALLLAGCTPAAPAPPQDIPTGQAMPPPIGAVDYCKRNPTDELCK